MTVTPYIIFNGQCEEALNLYARVLDGSIENLMYFEGSPVADKTGDQPKAVLHAHFRAGEIFLMASDNGAGPGSAKGGMMHLSLNFDNPEKQKQSFEALAEGGNITMPLNDTFWGATFGMLTDRFGVNWMFNYDKPGDRP